MAKHKKVPFSPLYEACLADSDGVDCSLGIFETELEAREAIAEQRKREKIQGWWIEVDGKEVASSIFGDDPLDQGTIGQARD